MELHKVKRASIIIPSFNSEEYIRASIDSVLSQTYPNIECIIVDGGSKDSTLEILKSYGNRIKYISEKDKGVFDALNKGIKLAEGEIIGWMGSDDFYANDYVVGRGVKEIEEAEVDICWGDLLYVDRENTEKILRYWKSSAYKVNDFCRGWQLPHFSSFIRKEAFNKYGYFREDLKIAADYEFFLRLLHVNKISSAYIPEVFIKMRTGGQSNFSLAGNKECYRAWALNGLKINPISIFLPKIFIKLSQYIKKP